MKAKIDNLDLQSGFSLMEILVVMGLIAVLAGVLVAAINPARQFALARNTQRSTDLSAILGAITQNMAEHQGKFDCGSSLPAAPAKIRHSGGVDLRPCLVPNYILELPVDPSIGHAWDQTFYDTGYEIKQDSVTFRITLKAAGAELEKNIELSR